MNFIFAFQDLQNSVPWGPLLHYVLICKMHIYKSKMALSSLLTKILFFSIEFVNFWDMTCFLPNLIPIWPRSHEL